MFCYECDQNGSAVGAIAICQRCGGAVCRKHARTLYHPGAPGACLASVSPGRNTSARAVSRESSLSLPFHRHTPRRRHA
jgi:predicted nucleic acid binding AN1-type Zn finger protein